MKHTLLLTFFLIVCWGAASQDTMTVHLKDGSKLKFPSTEVDSIRFQKVYKVGDQGPAGGWIIYDKGNYTNGWRYLEVAPNDISGSYPWGCSGSNVPTAINTQLGGGFENTNGIVTACNENGAARACYNYVLFGYDDWYLPNEAEILLFYTSPVSGLAGINFSTAYWTSEEFNTLNAYVRNAFVRVSNLKSNTNAVRPIRRF